MVKLLIASNNAHKHGELREIFETVDTGHTVAVELIAPRALGIAIDPVEDADTYAGNALLKARDFAAVLRGRRATQGGSRTALTDPMDATDPTTDAGATDTGGVWVIADDSGLEVDALGGRPGIYSARYHKRAPGGDGCAELLREMQGVPDEQRAARFQCAIVLIAPDGSEHTFAGTCEGRIGHEKRGSGGFGFDPVFVVGDGTRTMAELESHEKHRVSHRGVATRKVLAFLAGERSNV